MTIKYLIHRTTYVSRVQMLCFYFRDLFKYLLFPLSLSHSLSASLSFSHSLSASLTPSLSLCIQFFPLHKCFHISHADEEAKMRWLPFENKLFFKAKLACSAFSQKMKAKEEKYYRKELRGEKIEATGRCVYIYIFFLSPINKSLTYSIPNECDEPMFEINISYVADGRHWNTRNEMAVNTSQILNTGNYTRSFCNLLIFHIRKNN